MHRATPVATLLRSFSAGGARSVVDKINDGTFIQEMAGNFMKGETRDKIEAPQNYGFTSVVMPADKDAMGKIIAAAEAFISFIGGSRSFPVAAVMDDARYRLRELQAGDVAFFDHLQQQFHFNGNGAFLTGIAGKVIRMALAEVEKQAGEAPPGGSGTTNATAQQKYKGQKARYEKESKQYVEIAPDKTKHMNKKQEIWLDDEDTAIIMKDGKVYLGGDPDKHSFAKVLTESGPAKNVFARIE